MRSAAGALAFVFAALALSGCGSRPPARDVLIVTLDTTRADRLGCYGYDAAATPNLDAFARDAALFEDAVAPAPVTLPSHCTLFTGLNPYRHGVRYNAMFVLPQSIETLAERLRDAGFRTAAVPSSFAVAKRFGLAQGFESYEDLFAEPGGNKRGWSDERSAADAVDRAIAWWDGHRGERRFLWVHVYSPHWAYDPPFPFSVKFRDRPYDGEIAYADREVGRLFETLKAHGEWDDALVVVAGDHGEGLYEHGERWHSTLVYDATMHVPLIVKLPRADPGRRVRGPVGLVDVTPTVLSAVGLDVPRDLDGRPLEKAIAAGHAEADRPIYFECLAGSISYGWSPLYGVRRDTYKLIEGARPELYDVAADPHETRDLARSDADVVSALAEDLETFRTAGAQHDADAEAVVLDADALAGLASLGYVGGAGYATRAARSGGVHPPDMIDLEQEFLKAQAAIGAGRWSEASSSLDYVLKRDPANKFALFFRSRAFAQAGDHERALELARAMHRLYPDSADAADLLGETLSRGGLAEEAAEVYADACRSHPRDPRLAFRHFLAVFETGNAAATERAVEKLESDFPDRYTTFVARARLEARQGRIEPALRSLRSAVDHGLTSLRAFEDAREFREVRKSAAYETLAAKVAALGAPDEAVVTAKP